MWLFNVQFELENGFEITDAGIHMHDHTWSSNPAKFQASYDNESLIVPNEKKPRNAKTVVSRFSGHIGMAFSTKTTVKNSAKN